MKLKVALSLLSDDGQETETKWVTFEAHNEGYAIYLARYLVSELVEEFGEKIRGASSDISLLP